MKSAEQIYDFLDHYKLAVVSTVNEKGLPNAAIVGFGQTKNLELLFGTYNTSRKYKNLSKNQNVAFTVGGETGETIQYEGHARELSESELELVRKNYWHKNPYAEKQHNNPTHRYFIVTPTSVRYTDIRVNPWDITELKF
jgi:uncharacterized pyridoxamine 5'-phosphate oxidase family protein